MEASVLVGNILLRGGAALRGAAMRHGDLVDAMFDAGLAPLPIVTVVGLLVGGILAFIGATELSKFGARVYVANLVSIGMVRAIPRAPSPGSPTSSNAIPAIYSGEEKRREGIAWGRAWVALVGAMLMLSGCGTFPLPKIYILGDEAQPAPGVTDEAGLPHLELKTVIVPDYLDSTDILRRSASNEVITSTTGRWGERLSIGITHAVATDLVKRLPNIVIESRALMSRHIACLSTSNASSSAKTAAAP